MAKLTREKWIEAGINQLKELGPTAVSGEKIARRLDVTRGSFYHHFNNMDDFVNALLKHWEHHQTIQILNPPLAENSPEVRMNLLLESAWNSDADLEIAIRQWAFINEEVRSRVERTDRLRLGYLIAVYSRIADDDYVKGSKLAKVAYYGLLGALHAWPRLSRDQLKDMIIEIQALLTGDLKKNNPETPKSTG